MSKAIAGAAMIAADLAIGTVLFLNPELILPFGVMGANILNGILTGLFFGGVSLEAGALAAALTSNRGQNITTRMAAGLRQIIYGQQRIGGVVLYESTTGAGGSSGNYVYNFVIAIATHEIDAFINLYLDGRQVFWRQDGNAANVGCGSVYKSSTPGAGGPLVPALACTVSMSMTGAPTNELQNPTFDSGDGTGWTLQTGWVIGSGSPYGNGYLAQYTWPSGSGTVAQSAIINNIAIPATPGTVVTASCMAIGEPAATGHGVLYIAFYDSSNNVIQPGYYSGQVTNNYVWTALSVTATAPAGSVVAYVIFAVQNVTSAAGRWGATQFVAGYPTGSVTGITVANSSSPSGYSTVKAARYRVRIWGGGGSGATAYATNSGTPTIPVFTVVLTAGGSGYTSPPSAEVQGAYVFGGHAASDDQDPTHPGYGLGYGIAPSGEHYNFSGKIFAEVRFGDQLPTDSMASLIANDSAWPSTASVAGCAYIYLNLGYDTQLFPSLPEIRLTINGKNSIYDPRSGTTGFTSNWALQVADVITDPLWGLGDSSVNQLQLIAAANVCDEFVGTSQGAEVRYAQHLRLDTSSGPGDTLQVMMSSAAGRLGRIGGEWWIWPAYWQGPSIACDVSDLIDTPTWTPYRSYKELFNRVTGTYTAPNFPYNTAGNLYDANGWYYGQRDNTWPLAWQPTNFPEYAEDSLHGYAADQWLEEDGGQPLPKELNLRGVISIVQAQRVAKITLLRNRWQGTGSFRMNVGAWQIQPTDVITFAWNIFGWTEKMLEVQSAQFMVEPASGSSGEESALALSVQLAVAETDPTIYEWSTVEELTVYDVPANPEQIPTIPAPPTVLTVTSSAATAVVGADGIVIPRAELQWNSPLDISVTQIEMQYQPAGASAWIEAGLVDVGLFVGFVSGVVAGQTYNFRIRSIRKPGVWSAWVEVDGAVISMTLSNTTGTGYSVAPAGTLTAQALSDGTAQITVSTFTAVWGGLSVFCTPSPHILGGLNQNQLYYVYYVDPTFAGGAITPVATGVSSDFANKVGYFLIGQIVTPSYTPRYEPSTYHDAGTNATQNPTAVYDNDVTTDAQVSAVVWGTFQSSIGMYVFSAANGDCIWSGFPALTTSAAMTLHVLVAANVTSGANATMSVAAHVGGTTTGLFSASGSVAEADYTMTIPSGTNLNTISVEAVSSLIAPSPSTTNLSQYANLQSFEVYIE